VELHQRQNRAGRFTSFFATGLFSGCALAYGGFAIADRPAQQSSTNSSGNGTAASDAAAAGDSTGTQSAPSGAGEGAAKADATGTALAEIMVTAQRRSETAQSVPISLQVVTGAQLQQQYIVDASSLARVSPALNFAQGTAPSASAFALRGVSSLAQNAGVQPSTALVVDDVPLVRQGEYVAQLSDIDNIQILNGPQGTLFGKNSTAGVINIVTVQPTREFESWLEGGVTNDNGYSARGMVNVPLSDQIQTRWNFFYQNQNPIVPNRGGPGLDGDVSTGIEGKLAYQITSKLDALVKIDYDHDNSTFLGLVPIHASTNPGETTVLGYTPQWGDAFVNENQKSIGQTITRSGMLRLTYDISDAWRLTSVSSYHYFHAGSLLDTDTTPVGNVLGVGFAPNPTNYKFAAIIPSLGLNRLEDDAHYWSEEDRFNYNSSNLKLVTGVFYQNVDGFYRTLRRVNPGPTLFKVERLPITSIKPPQSSVMPRIPSSMASMCSRESGIRMNGRSPTTSIRDS